MNLMPFTLVKTTEKELKSGEFKKVVHVLNENYQKVKTFTSKLSFEKCYGRARAFLTAENEKFMENRLTCQVGDIFNINIQDRSQTIAKTQENTFQIFSKDYRSATVDGDLLINILYGKENINNLKFE